LSIPVANIGPGVARIRSVRLRSTDTQTSVPARRPPRALPGERSSRLEFGLVRGVAGDRATVEIEYTDVSGGQAQRTTLQLKDYGVQSMNVRDID
jgi:hypothetical protein